MVSDDDYRTNNVDTHRNNHTQTEYPAILGVKSEALLLTEIADTLLVVFTSPFPMKSEIGRKTTYRHGGTYIILYIPDCI